MAKNKVQFQTGISLQNFLSQFGSEDQCRTTLFRWRWPQGFVCPTCGHGDYCELKGRKLYQCNSCHSQVSLTSGTIFAYTKIPLTTWFLGIYFITQSKVSVSALSLKRTIGVSYNTALLMKHKIQQVMKERDDSKPLTHLPTLSNLMMRTGVAKNAMASEAAGRQERSLFSLLYRPMSMAIPLKCDLAR